MKKLIVLSTALFFAANIFAQNYYTRTSGLWNDNTNVWSTISRTGTPCSCNPGSSLSGSKSVYIYNNVSASSFSSVSGSAKLTVESGDTLIITDTNTFTISGSANITVNVGGTLIFNSNIAMAGGNSITNNGTVIVNSTITNTGSSVITVTGTGTLNVYGNISTVGSSSIVTSGTTYIYGNVQTSSSSSIITNGTAYIYGNVTTSGSSGFSGTGNVYVIDGTVTGHNTSMIKLFPAPIITALRPDSTLFVISNSLPGVIYSWTALDSTGVYTGNGDTAKFTFKPRNCTLIYLASDPMSGLKTLSTLGVHRLPPPPCLISAGFNVYLINQRASALANTTFNCQSILIAGTFIVDKNTVFSGCDVQIYQNSTIAIINNANLTIQSATNPCSNCSHLHAYCPYMWGAIDVFNGSTLTITSGTLIEDAMDAVVAEDYPNAVFQINGTCFNKNYEDIVLKSVSLPYSGFVQNSEFTCRNLSSVPTCNAYFLDFFLKNYSSANLLPPYSSTITSRAIDVNYISNWSISNNFFDNIHTGIYSYASNLTVLNNTFQYVGSAGSDAGVYAVGLKYPIEDLFPGGGNSLTVGTTAATTNHFTGCRNGVIANTFMKNVNVNYNYFLNSAVNSVLDEYSQITGSTLNVTNNNITIECGNANMTSITATNNSNINANVSLNTIQGCANCCFSFTSPPGGPQININEVGNPATALYTVTNNTVNTADAAIEATSTYNTVISTNKVYLNDYADGSADVGGFGINVNSNQSSVIYDNLIDESGISNIPCPNPYAGIYEFQSPSSSISCNNTKNCDFSILCRGSDVGTQNISNSMDAASNFAAIGIYAYLGGLNGSVQGGGIFANDTWTGSFQCRTSMVGSSGVLLTVSPAVVNCTSSLYPACGSGCSFFGTNNCFGLCASLVCAPPPAALVPDAYTISLYENIAKSSGVFATVGDTDKRLNKLALLKILWISKPLLAADSVLNTFSDSMKNTSMGKIIAIDTNINMDTNASYLSSLLTSVNAISPESNIESNLKLTASSFIYFRLHDTLPLQLIYALRILAAKCPDFDGPGVFEARSILSGFDTNFHPPLPENCNSNPATGQRKASFNKTANNSQGNTASLFKIYPNPNKGNFTIEYSLDGTEAGKVVIYNLMGEEMGNYELSPLESKIQISNSNLSSGVYIYKLYVTNSPAIIGKVIIMK